MSRKGRPWPVAYLVAAQLSLAASLHAHPPSEYTARLVKGPNGPLHLVLVTGDGIVFYDPVALEVRDGSGKLLAFTPAGREVVLACWPFTKCTAFRYEGFFPVLPADVWQLQGEKLVKVGSAGYQAVGLFIPLLDNWLGYLVAILFLTLPLLALRNALAAPDSGRRTARILLAGLGGTFIWVLWLYAVVLLSPLSLPLIVMVLTATVAGYRMLRVLTAHATQSASTI